MITELAPGLHRWSARHPEWHPGAFGAEVGSYAALVAGDHLLVVDPLLPGDPAEVWALLEDLRRPRVTVAVTIPYHVRDAEEVARRLGGVVTGHRGVARRLGAGARFEELVPGAEGDFSAHTIGKPRRNELPLHLPSHDALVFGDAVVTTPDGELRIWDQVAPSPERRAFIAERFGPTLEPLVDLAPERVLVTHGAPILRDGAGALRAAIDAGAWSYRG